MTGLETTRAYATEPIISALALSLLVNSFGSKTNAAFMHEEARDILSLGVVLLGAALALWIGLFWISSTEFGQWLSTKNMLEPINAAYVVSASILLCCCVACILCAHISASYTALQLTGEFLSLCGLVCMPTLLNNTRHLLRLHGLYGRQPKAVSEIRTPAAK
jgi:hypothetical protein